MYLGLDLSTQKLKALLLNESLHIVKYFEVDFDRELSEFNTQNGVIINSCEADSTSHIENKHNKNAPFNEIFGIKSKSLEYKCPPFLWVAALDLLINKINNDNSVHLNQIKCIAGCAQQHGSVYWRKDWKKNINIFLNYENKQEKYSNIDDMPSIKLDFNQSLLLNYQHLRPFSVDLSPVWLDSSTGEQCRLLRECVGFKWYNIPLEESIKLRDNKNFDEYKIESVGDKLIAIWTGSRVQERFTLPQVMKIYSTQPNNYHKTERISLISSFLASLFLLPRIYAPIDFADGSGTNFMHIVYKSWSTQIMDSLLQQPRFKEMSLLTSKLGEPCQHSKDENFSPFSFKRYYKSQAKNVLVSCADEKNNVSSVGNESNKSSTPLFKNYLEFSEEYAPSLVPTPTILGTISPYFVQRFHFNPECKIAAFTGDNLASLVGSRAGPTDLIISLGTSDTILFWNRINPESRNIIVSADPQHNCPFDSTTTTKKNGLNECSEARNKSLENVGSEANHFDTLNGPSAIDSAHSFVNPISPFEHYVALLCYKNGSLTRESILEANILMNKSECQASLTTGKAIWNIFDEILSLTPAGNNGNIGFYYCVSEITPRLKVSFSASTEEKGQVADEKEKGQIYLQNNPLIYRYDVERKLIPPGENKENSKYSNFLHRYSGPFPSENSFSHELRALIEGRFMAMKNHVKALRKGQRGCVNSYDAIKFNKEFERIIVSGGASINPNILHIMSNVFGLPVYILPEQYLESKDETKSKLLTESAALGSGYLAKFSLEIKKYIESQSFYHNKDSNTDHKSLTDFNNSIPFSQLFDDMTKSLNSPRLLIEPDLNITKNIYDKLS
ncbi:unnamed protein product, partial [Gordionus sp. m RMFG-2023]